jgi:hypothetical protein
MAHNPKSKMAIDRYNTLKVERQTWESHWQEVADYCLPRKADITKSRSKGDKRTEFIYDGTATHALELLAASLHGMLTNTVSPWFYLKYKNDELNKEDEAVEWLENCTQVMNQAFNRSNFQQEIFELYHDLIAFGTAALFIAEDKDNDLRFKNLHISEIYITENEKGFVDSLTRHFKMQARNLPNQFPDAVLPPELVKKIEKNPYDRVNIIHCIHANPDYSETKKFVSHYVHEDSGTLLSEGFFADFPFAVPRYLKSSNEIYGRSPAMNALADVKMLNLMSKTSIKAAQKQIDPPLMVPDDGFLMPIRTVPGGLNYYRSGTRDRIEPMNIGANTPIGLNMEEQRRDAIRQNFFVDQLMTNQGATMTATEVIQRNEEKMRILGPVLGRLQSELLQPLITRSFNILNKNKKFLPVPEMLGETDIEIEYVSPLAKAQKTGDLQALMRGIEIFGSLQQVSPVMDYLDTDNLVQYIKEILGIPAKILKSRDQVALQRQDQEAQQMQQMQLQQEMQQAEIANKAAPMAKVLNESN